MFNENFGGRVSADTYRYFIKNLLRGLNTKYLDYNYNALALPYLTAPTLAKRSAASFKG